MFDESETIVWMSDDKTKDCLSCHKKFSILRRKVRGRNLIYIK